MSDSTNNTPISPVDTTFHDADYSSNITKKVTVDTLKQYEIDYYKVMKNEELVQLFKEHLKKEFNTEPIDCTLEMNKFSDLIKSGNGDWIALGDGIENTFLKNGSSREINLPANVRSNCLQKWNTLKDMKSRQKELSDEEQKLMQGLQQNLYREVLTFLNASLKVDSFPRFIR